MNTGNVRAFDKIVLVYQDIVLSLELTHLFFIGNNMNHINDQPFTTRDRDNDASIGNNCATYHSNHFYNYNCESPCSNNAGWWYKDSPCSFAHLNSPYGTPCLRWYELPGEECNIKYTDMKIRPY